MRVDLSYYRPQSSSQVMGDSHFVRLQTRCRPVRLSLSHGIFFDEWDFARQVDCTELTSKSRITILYREA